VIHPRPAPLLRDRDAQEAELRQARHELRRMTVLAIDLGGLGQHFALREITRGLLNGELFFGQRELHGRL
jgi:hypothetical protein